MVRLLLGDPRTDPYAGSDEVPLPIQYAVRAGSLDIVRLFEEAGHITAEQEEVLLATARKHDREDIASACRPPAERQALAPALHPRPSTAWLESHFLSQRHLEDLSPRDQVLKMWQEFQKQDLDHSMSIDKAELRVIAAALGTPLTEPELAEAQIALDTNGDGSVRVFLRAVLRRPARQRPATPCASALRRWTLRSSWRFGSVRGRRESAMRCARLLQTSYPRQRRRRLPLGQWGRCLRCRPERGRARTPPALTCDGPGWVKQQAGNAQHFPLSNVAHVLTSRVHCACLCIGLQPLARKPACCVRLTHAACLPPWTCACGCSARPIRGCRQGTMPQTVPAGATTRSTADVHQQRKRKARCPLTLPATRASRNDSRACSNERST